MNILIPALAAGLIISLIMIFKTGNYRQFRRWYALMVGLAAGLVGMCTAFLLPNAGGWWFVSVAGVGGILVTGFGIALAIQVWREGEKG